MINKIGILGLAGSGKDTFAAYLAREFRKNHINGFDITRYAALLKEGARQVFGEDFDNRDVKEERRFVTPDLADKIIDSTDYIQLKLNLDPEQFTKWDQLCSKHLDKRTWLSPREYQVIVGSIGREIDKEIWVNYLRHQKGQKIVADVRFPNELLDVNILVIRSEVTAAVSGPLHASELYAYDLSTSVSPYHDVDYVVYNNGTLADLENKAKQTVSHIIRNH